jgi:hypothetical protein
MKIRDAYNSGASTLLKKIHIRKRQRGFLYTKGDYERMLTAGEYWLFGWPRSHEVAIHDTHKPELESADLTTLLADPQVLDEVEVVDVTDKQRALLWVDGRLYRILGPGKRAFWKSPHELVVEVIDASLLSLEHESLDVLLNHADAPDFLQQFNVPDGSKALLYINEHCQTLLESGRYVYWKGLAKVHAHIMDLRELQLDVAGQEILTKDNVSLRVNLVATWKIVDPELLVSKIPSGHTAVYRELQLALRALIGGHTLEDLLAQKDAMSKEIKDQVAPTLEALGLSLLGVGMKDVILPGDMKQILNKVIEAEKQAKANLITRREETAATRSLLNTARMMENNPTLLRLKELETAERIAARVHSIHITNGLDDLINRLVPPRE